MNARSDVTELGCTVQCGPTIKDCRCRRPEAAVVDEISRLIDESLDAGDRSRTWIEPLADDCPLCGREWHGLPDYRCPGPYADAEANDPAALDEAYSFDGYLAQRAEIVGGPCVLPQIGTFGSEHDEAQWALDATQQPMRWLRDAVGERVVSRMDTFDPERDSDGIDRLMNAVLAMLAEVVGIHLCENDFDEAIEYLRGMADSHREERQRRGRLRHGGSGAPRSYTLSDLQDMREGFEYAHHNRPTLQGLQSRGYYQPSLAGDQRRRQPEARPAMRDASTSIEEAQQD